MISGLISLVGVIIRKSHMIATIQYSTPKKLNTVITFVFIVLYLYY